MFVAMRFREFSPVHTPKLRQIPAAKYLQLLTFDKSTLQACRRMQTLSPYAVDTDPQGVKQHGYENGRPFSHAGSHTPPGLCSRRAHGWSAA